MLPQAADRIAVQLPRDARVLHVRAGGAEFDRADVVLDDARRDVCARDPWPFPDGRFDFAVCTRLAHLRDPVGVCAELARVARAGYVEVPVIEAELAGGDARWLCDVSDAEMVFVHKPREVLTDPRVRVGQRRLDAMPPSERVHALFWEGRLPARERFVEPGTLVGELAERLRRRFEPTGAEVAFVEARRLGGLAGEAALRTIGTLRERL